MSNVFQRLIGLETEYAIRFQPQDRSQPPPSRFRLYEALRSAIDRRILTVPAKHFKEGVFTANGGAVWFEAERPSAGGGLIEGATPECRSPIELLAYQRAQDRLVAECAADTGLHGEFRLIKNDRDSLDNIYGAQENYQASLASGFTLVVWRIGLVLLFPLALLTWIGILISVLATLCYFALAGIAYLPIRLATGGRRSIALFLFGRDLVEGRDTCVHVPVWLESTLQVLTRLLTAPLALALYLLLSLAAFRKQRAKLVPFLITRTIFTGAGLVDSNGRFQLADKAPAINCLLGFCGMFFDRPLFSMGHFFKEIYAESWFSPRNYFSLMSPNQRLQIALGDSNMCETAEYLRIGTTLLVLDAIEAGEISCVPRLRSPIRGLRQICSDPGLTAEVTLKGGDTASALEIQRYYLGCCRQFLNANPEAPAEAWEILRLWRNTLDDLSEIAEGREVPDELIGNVDWVTKKYFLDHAAKESSWAERKKVDICYHELSEHGYYRLLADGGLVSHWVSDDEVDRAIRTPPANSPATTRGHYIREFARSEEPISANWKCIVIGNSWDARTVRIGDYGKMNSTLARQTNSVRVGKDV